MEKKKKDTEPHKQRGGKGLAVGTMAQRPSSPWAALAHAAQLWDVKGVGESRAQKGHLDAGKPGKKMLDINS